jgi:hypothetical protein
MYRLLSVGLLCAAVLLPAGCQDKKTTAPLGAAAGTAGRKSYDRGEFEKMVIGKSVNEVITALGQPDQRVPAGNKEEVTYASISKNGAKTDLAAHIHFENGRATKVEYVE